ncbi:MAG: iron-containing alcohol dehydrogenase [candidate division Zixibacteria bacterium]|nr:iron-containing alcohol dehydrogenase [candidate division Zixibacteria bacterium]MDH3937182.1 iron-containing alcohol dehydrogenase [candidate division Zixibacteria bacterium]MDH4032445.1 iron-containing alcohol dehydrogenase [candidate division Zixibacteria bacterium]
MQNFDYRNPVRILFGKGQIAKLASLVDRSHKIMLIYGGGSIKKNGVYDQVTKALSKVDLIEFSGIEPNPQYDTCMKAVDAIKNEKVDFLLAVGGGSVVDATKFIAAAACFKGADPWAILSQWKPVREAVPFGSVLTLPGTGSEMNSGSVISRAETDQKLFFNSPAVYPQFSILDPETTFSLPTRQTINGIIDAYVHVAEQYLTYPVNSPLQDRYCESVLLTLIEEGPKVLREPNDYDARANVMWCATCALNGSVAPGTPSDWATHIIGHEITAQYGLDHAQTLALVLPGTLQVQREAKKDKLLQYGARVFGIDSGADDERIDATITATEEFFRSLGQMTRLSEYEIADEACDIIARRMGAKPVKFGEHQDIGQDKTREIMKLRV